MKYIRSIFFVATLLILGGAPAAAQWAPGDTLTVIQRPLLNIPSLVLPDGLLEISCVADPTTVGWTAALERGELDIPLSIEGAVYSAQSRWWTLSARMPDVPIYDLYDLHVTAAGGVDDVTRNAVRILPTFKDDFYFVHITDTHLPTHLYYYESGADTDSSSTVDLREIINDVNVINPEFVLLTGDLVNEGELEDFLNKRYYSRAQRQLTEFSVPVYLTAGNHDLGGWGSTPPSDGTARRDWWRFFGWRRLDDPPSVVPWRTQNYSFDYGAVHLVGLESYRNYDNWRDQYYDYESFTSPQLDWLQDDLAATPGNLTTVLFYHYDFQSQLDLYGLDVDMALWGHIHRNSGNLSSPPFNLATDQATDGARAFRLIRFSGGQLVPRPTLYAGGAGQTLQIQYAPDNSGAHDQVTVQVSNTHGEAFEHGRVRVQMPAGAAGYTVTGGQLYQLDDTGSVAVCYVDVAIPASGTVNVTVAIDESSSVEPPSPVVQVLQARPNPFNPRTELAFGLDEDAVCRLTVFDLQGRMVRILADGILAAGQHTYMWDGCDTQGRALTSSIYLVSLRTGDQTQTRKLTLVR